MNNTIQIITEQLAKCEEVLSDTSTLTPEQLDDLLSQIDNLHDQLEQAIKADVETLKQHFIDPSQTTQQ